MTAGTPEPGNSRGHNFSRWVLTVAAVVLATLAGATPAAETDTAQKPCSAPEASDTAQDHKRVVIIIDDIGHNLERGREAVALPGKITYAVIPFTPFGSQLAEAAHEAGKEVMLHAPMSTLDLTPLGFGGLTPELSRREFRDALMASIEAVPHVKGVNNHMGSDLTARRQQMAWLMRELRWQGLYFVDSRTSKETVAATVAGEFNVPHLSRHVFLDNDTRPEAIAERFGCLLRQAESKGLAVGIGHPHPETLAFLKETLPGLAEQGVELLLVSEALEPVPAGKVEQDKYYSAPGC